MAKCKICEKYKRKLKDERTSWKGYPKNYRLSRKRYIESEYNKHKLFAHGDMSMKI